MSWPIPNNLMAAKITLCLSVMLGLVASISCPTFTCTSLGANICATKISATSFQVNDNGCETGYYCSGSGLQVWAQYSTSTTTDDPFPCLPGTYLSAVNLAYAQYGSNVNFTCSTFDPNKKFKNGNLVVSCSSDSDCVFADGKEGDCDCALNSESMGLCRVSSKNEDFFGSDYTRDCGTNNTITDRNTYIYWAIYAASWWIDQGTISCTDIFAEIDNFSDFEDQIATGVDHDIPSWASGYTAVTLGFLGLLALH